MTNIFCYYYYSVMPDRDNKRHLCIRCTVNEAEFFTLQIYKMQFFPTTIYRA